MYRRKRFDSAVTCSICKEKRAYHTVHGFRRYGGNTCCHVCYPKIQEEYKSEQEREADYEMTEADYQTWYRL